MGRIVVAPIAPALCKPFAVSCKASRMVPFVICHYLDQFFRPKHFIDTHICIAEQFVRQSPKRLQFGNGLYSSGPTN
jgi:hypothetical protein